MATEPKTLFLLDAYALIFRAHFAFTKNPRINSKGRNTSVPFGFTNTLMEVLKKQAPTHIAVAFDTPSPTFRNEIFKEYKANRQETPEAIKDGVPTVKKIIAGFNIPIIEKEGFEADDIIGTIAVKAAKQGFEVFMMTLDKDFGQIVDSNIKLYKPSYQGNAIDIMGSKEVCEKWDIDNVNQVIDMLGLQGDAVDNIPGIPGVGPKTAAQLIKQYGSLEAILKNSDELKGKLKERVIEFGEQALLSKKLATIITNVPIEYNEEDMRYKGPDKELLQPIFEDLEFKTLSARLWKDELTPESAKKASKGRQLSLFDAPQEDYSTPSNITNNSYSHFTEVEQVKSLVGILNKQTEFSFQVVADNSDNLDFKIHGFAFGDETGATYFVAFSDENLKLLSEVISDEKISKIGYDLKFSALVLKRIGVELKGPLFDTLIAHYLIEPESSHDLSILSQQFLNHQLTEGNSNLELVMERVNIMLPLKKKLSRELEQRRNSLLMSSIEMPLVYALASMEFEGINIDVETLSEMSLILKEDSELLRKEIFASAGSEFNIASPKQLGEVLFDKLQLLDKPKKTKTGQYATGEEVLQKLAADHQIAQQIIQFREIEKLRSTYVDALPRMVSNVDGRIHSDFRQAVAATGRLSSNNPNLQNIPIRTERGRLVRKAFVARNEGYRFMSVDYSQIELRIVASFAEDKTMIEAFRNKRDIHATTAAKVFNVAIDQVTPEMRRKAKEVNFGILYGSSAFGLAQNLRISRTEAMEIIDSYFKEFAGIKRYMENSINKAREHGYVETILGRRRYLPDINSRNTTTRGFAERNAINAPIQGSAADIIKIAMVNIHNWLKNQKLKTKMILQVHDELVFDLAVEETEIVKPKVVDLMKTAIIIEVPMEVEVGIAQNWLEAH